MEDRLRKLGFHEIAPGIYQIRFGSDQDLAWTIQADLKARLLTVERGNDNCQACTNITMHLLDALGMTPDPATHSGGHLQSFSKTF